MWRFARQLVRQAEDIIAPDLQETGPTYGFRVLHVEEGSEAQRAGIEPLFDFVVGVNNHDLGDSRRWDSESAESPPVDELKHLLGEKDRAVLSVWTMKGKITRQVTVPIHRGLDTFGLGLCVQWTNLKVGDHVWHILGISDGSPAEEAGLIPNTDFIVGAEQGLLEQGGESLLARVATRFASDEKHDGFEVYVYNSDTNTVRPVQLAPRFDPTGKRLLGCSVGYGYLHLLPAVTEDKLSNTEAATKSPSNTRVADEPLSEDAFIPGQAPTINQPSAFALPPTGPAPRHSHRARHHGPEQDLSAYFEEETAKSHEIDGPGAAVSDEVAPPPPAAAPAAAPPAALAAAPPAGV